MEKFLFAAHSGWRWIAVVALLLAIGHGLWGWLGNHKWTATSRKIALFATIALDIQLLLGLALYGMGRRFDSAFSTQVRFEHPTIMIVALVLIHVVSKRLKGDTGNVSRFKTLALGMIGVLALVVLGVLRLPGGAERLFSMTAM